MKVLSGIIKIYIACAILSLFAGTASAEGEPVPAAVAEPVPAVAAEPVPAVATEPVPAVAAEPEPAAAAESVPAVAAEPVPAAAAEPEPATAGKPAAAASADKALAESTAPVGKVYVADEPYLLLAEENKGLKDKLAEAETQIEDIKAQLDELKQQIAQKDSELAAQQQGGSAVTAPAAVAAAPEATPAATPEAVATAAPAAAPAGGGEAAAPSGECKEVKIMATATTFEPKVVFINPCDTVYFNNMITHDAQAFDELVPEGVEPFWVKLNQNGKVTLTVEGVYVYKCNPHYPLGMAGAIVVGKPVNMTQVEAKVTGRAKGIVIKLKKELEQKKG